MIAYTYLITAVAALGLLGVAHKVADHRHCRPEAINFMIFLAAAAAMLAFSLLRYGSAAALAVPPQVDPEGGDSPASQRAGQRGVGRSGAAGLVEQQHGRRGRRRGRSNEVSAQLPAVTHHRHADRTLGRAAVGRTAATGPGKKQETQAAGMSQDALDHLLPPDDHP